MKFQLHARLAAGLFAVGLAQSAHGGTVALWLFDSQKDTYPSCALPDASGNDYFLILGRGAHLVDGRYGTALQVDAPRPLQISGRLTKSQKAGTLFGLIQAPTQRGRTVPPMTWQTATFAGLMTAGEGHLRKPSFANPSDTRLNLGDFDWTVEFWFKASSKNNNEGVVFEEGSGPRGENDHVTRLVLSPSRGGFELTNQPSGTTVFLASSKQALQGGAWHHYAFVYSAHPGELRHYVDGVPQGGPHKAKLAALQHGDEAYFSLGRNGTWQQPLPGALDEMRFSDEQVYKRPFTPPVSFNHDEHGPDAKPGIPLLFAGDHNTSEVLDLGSRKYLFIDDAIIAKHENVSIVPNPPLRAEKVIDRIRGHMSIVEDDSGTIRLYYDGPKDSLAVMTSKDGIHWSKPDLKNGVYEGERNVVLRDHVGLGTVFVDPNAPPERRWVYVSGIRKESIFVFTSADGYNFKRNNTAALPFSAGSQTDMFYDDQRGLYIGQHRSDYGETVGGATSRRYIQSEVTHLDGPWPYTARWGNKSGFAEPGVKVQSDVLDPWFLDNGPLTPPGPGAELPTVIGVEPQDPGGTDVYVTKAIKYPWAPDTYLAFPSVYFHYWEDGPDARMQLGTPEVKRGSGVTETQLEVSRDGQHWHRLPRPAYSPISDGGRDDLHMQFMVQGLVKRDDEIWQYVGGHPGGGMGYHSPWTKGAPSPLYRLVQRMDGFAAAEGSYTGGSFVTKKLRFTGTHLYLNIDTGAAGYAQVGLLDENARPIPGYGVDDCVYINGDQLHTTVQWINKGSDLASLEGKPVQLVVRLHGARLYTLQFAN